MIAKGAPTSSTRYNVLIPASRLDGRCPAIGLGLSSGRGKSGLHRTRWWVTPTVRKDRESATENIPPAERSRESEVRSQGSGGRNQGVGFTEETRVFLGS